MTTLAALEAARAAEAEATRVYYAVRAEAEVADLPRRMELIESILRTAADCTDLAAAREAIEWRLYGESDAARRNVRNGLAVLSAVIAQVDGLHCVLPIAEEAGDAADLAHTELFGIVDALCDLETFIRAGLRRI